MSLAETGGLILGESVPFASASMAIVVSADSGIHELNEIAAPGVKLVLAHADVPAGQYARQLLSGLSQSDAGPGADFSERALANVVSEETSVKFVEQKVVLGQADAGIVYRPGANHGGGLRFGPGVGAARGGWRSPGRLPHGRSARLQLPERGGRIPALRPLSPSPGHTCRLRIRRALKRQPGGTAGC